MAKPVAKKRALFTVREKNYQKLIENAVAVRDAQMNNTDPKTGKNSFGLIDSIPTVEQMKQMNIGPHEGSYMDIYVLAYLVFYAEEYCVDEENDEWEYIYQPDPEYFEPEELEEFEESRKYMQRTIIKRVERVQ